MKLLGWEEEESPGMDIPPIIVTGGIFPPSGNILKEIRRGGSIHENGKCVKVTHGIMLCLHCVNPLHPRILHCYSLALFENLVWRVFGMSLFSFPLPGMQAAMVDASASASNHPNSLLSFHTILSSMLCSL